MSTRYAHADCIGHVKHPATRAPKGLCILPSTDRAALVAFADEIATARDMMRAREMMRRRVPNDPQTPSGAICPFCPTKVARDGTKHSAHKRGTVHAMPRSTFAPTGGIVRDHICPANPHGEPFVLIAHACPVDDARENVGSYGTERYRTAHSARWETHMRAIAYSAEPAVLAMIGPAGPRVDLAIRPEDRTPRPILSARPASRPADPAPAAPARPARASRATARPARPARPAALARPADPAPARVARPDNGKPTCERCGRTFRKSGVGYAWHRMNRPDCGRTLRAVPA